MTVCARGAGRGYGDLALNDRNGLIDVKLLNRILEFDEEHHTIKVESGAQAIAELEAATGIELR